MIRVLRLLEYEYDTPERAEQDMGRWQIPANGSYNKAYGIVVRSSVIINLNAKKEEGDA